MTVSRTVSCFRIFHPLLNLRKINCISALTLLIWMTIINKLQHYHDEYNQFFILLNWHTYLLSWSKPISLNQNQLNCFYKNIFEMIITYLMFAFLGLKQPRTCTVELKWIKKIKYGFYKLFFLHFYSLHVDA
jgi:hypothetical protein